jgi:hypothetical protein
VGLSGRRILGFVQPISARLRAEEILHRFPCVNCLTSSLPIAGSRRDMLYYRLQANIRRNGCNLFQRPPVFPATGQNGPSQLIPPATYLSPLTFVSRPHSFCRAFTTNPMLENKVAWPAGCLTETFNEDVCSTQTGTQQLDSGTRSGN